MKPVPWLAALLGFAVAAAELHGQGIANSNPAVRGSGISFSVTRSSRARPVYLSGYLVGSYGVGYPLGSTPYEFGQITIVQAPRPVLVIVLARDDTLSDDRPPNDIVRIRPHRKTERVLGREPPPEAPEPRPEPINPPQPKEPPKTQPKPPEPPRVQPEADPKAESIRHLALGKEAFAAGEYGRAAFRFKKAAELAPDQALPQFLLAQALFALGKYRAAVDAIRTGLPLDPTWPATGPRPSTLYGDNVADYPEHLQQLGDALSRHADDPVLLFLSAYFLWFDGRKIEARPLFEKAAALVPDRRDIDSFLRAMPE